jgi:modulator of FtsH protease
MQRDSIHVVQRGGESALATNKVLKNTYMLLGLTFLFSALMAYIGVATNAPPLHFGILIVGFWGLMYLTERFKDSPLGLVFVFAFTGFIGFSVAPMLSFYMAHYSNGGQLVTTALAGTGIIFFALSAYALTTRKDFSFMGGFLLVGGVLLMLGVVANLFFQMPAIQLGLSALFILFSSSVILYQTSLIIHGGERNYISATLTIFVSLYNIFVSLLQILGAFGGED